MSIFFLWNLACHLAFIVLRCWGLCLCLVFWAKFCRLSGFDHLRRDSLVFGYLHDSSVAPTVMTILYYVKCTKLCAVCAAILWIVANKSTLCINGVLNFHVTTLLPCRVYSCAHVFII